MIGQAAEYNTTGPVVDNLGTAVSGYRTSATANGASDLPTGTRVILTIVQDASAAVWAVWLADYDHSAGTYTRVTELAAAGSFANDDAVTIYVNGAEVLTNVGEQVKAHGTLSGNATLDVAEGHVHTVTIDANRTLTLENTQGHTGTGLTLIITKGANTITWAGDFTNASGWIGTGGTPPDISAADTYVIFFHWLGSASTCYAVYGGTL